MSKYEIFLELEKKNSDGSTFYRYRFGDIRFWFDKAKEGAIYCVYIASDSGEVEYYLDCRANDEALVWPTKTRFRFTNKFLSADEADGFIKVIEKAKFVASTIDEFFEKKKG